MVRRRLSVALALLFSKNFGLPRHHCLSVPFNSNLSIAVAARAGARLLSHTRLKRARDKISVVNDVGRFMNTPLSWERTQEVLLLHRDLTIPRTNSGQNERVHSGRER